MSTITANDIIPSASTSENVSPRTSWGETLGKSLKADLGKACLSVPELGYYSLFVHAVIFRFFIGTWSTILFGEQIKSYFSGVSEDDQLALTVIWLLVFLFVTIFICLHLFRVYGRIVANEDELLKLSPELKDGALEEKWYFKKIAPVLDHLFRGATLLLLLRIERLAGLQQESAGDMTSILHYWGEQVIWIYFVLWGYSVLINIPKMRSLENGMCRDQAIGFFKTDAVALLAWLILWRAIPWFGSRESFFVQTMLAMVCAILLYFCFVLERRYPLIEPVGKYLMSHSLIKSTLLLSLFIAFVAVVVDVSCP